MGEHPLIVRAAGPDDADAISALTAAVQAFHAVNRSDVFRPVEPGICPAALIRELLAAPDRLFLVAVAGGAVVGHAYAEVQLRPTTPFKHAVERLYVHQMAVAAEHRGRGVGTRLLGTLEVAAQDAGLDTVALDVYAFNAAARRVYERAGYTPDRVYLTRAVGPGRAGLSTLSGRGPR